MPNIISPGVLFHSQLYFPVSSYQVWALFNVPNDCRLFSKESAELPNAQETNLREWTSTSGDKIRFPRRLEVRGESRYIDQRYGMTSIR